MTAHTPAKTDRKQSRLYAAAYGQAHLSGRLEAVGGMNEIREERPECRTVGYPRKCGEARCLNTTYA